MRKYFLILMALISLLTACDNTPTVEEFTKDATLRKEAIKICKDVPRTWRGFDPDNRYYQYCTNLADALGNKAFGDYRGYTKMPPMEALP